MRRRRVAGPGLGLSGCLAVACLLGLLRPAAGDKWSVRAVGGSRIGGASLTSEDVRRAWLRCGRGEEIDWPRLRDKLSSYADKYIEAPQLFTEEARLAYGHAFTQLLLPADAPCPLGDLSLRLFMWLFVDPKDLLQAAIGTPDYAAQPGSQDPPGMLADAMWQVFAIPVPWVDLFQTGWPIFSILAQISIRLRREMEASGEPPAAECEDVAIWGGPSYLSAVEASFRTGAQLPLHASLAALLALDREACPLAFASALLALADSGRWDATDAGLGGAGGRNAAYYRYAAVPPIATEGTMLADLGANVGRAYADDIEALVGTSVQAIRSMGDAELRSSYPTSVLITRWPIWRLLDRLACDEWVRVRALAAEPTGLTRRLRSASPHFFLHVFPHRVSSDGLQSSVTRASRRAYCAKEFQNELDGLRLRFAPSPGTRLRVVEAGPHLGDCIMWAAARVGCGPGRLKATGYDVIHQLVALMRKSIARNGAEGCLDAKLAFLTEDLTRSTYAGVGPVTLDSEVAEYVHLMKVHTNGGEDAILRGGRRLFREFGVGVVVVNSATADVLVRVVEFLASYGGPPYELEARGEPLSGTLQAMSDQLHEAMGRGSVQLVARRSDLPALPEPGANLTRWGL